MKDLRIKGCIKTIANGCADINYKGEKVCNQDNVNELFGKTSLVRCFCIFNFRI